MVTYIRCPYCGHPEVEPTALYCPACDGEIQGETSSSDSVDMPEIGSLSASPSNLDLEELLSLSSNAVDAGDVLNLSAKAPTLDQMVGVKEVSFEAEPDKSGLGVTLARAPETLVPDAIQTPTSAQRRSSVRTAGWGMHVYLLLMVACIVGVIFLGRPVPVDGPPSHQELSADLSLIHI